VISRAGGCRDRGRDDVDQLERGGHTALLAPAGDVPGDPVGVALLAVVTQEPP